MSPAPFAERVERFALDDGATLACAIAPAQQTSNRCVVLLHGLASNRSRWAEFVEATTLTRRFDVLRVDLRGHGESTPPPGASDRLTLERWCDDLAQLLVARADAQAVIIGHSLGAQVALAFAARHADRCVALGLIDPVFRKALRGKWRLIATLGPLFALAAGLVRALNRLGLRRRFVQPYDLRALDALARRSLQSKQTEAAFIRQYSSTRADLRHFRTANYLQDLVEMFRPEPPLASLRQPALILLSTGGTFADPDTMTRMLATLPRQQTVRIECHHWPLTERPAEVRAAIEAWCGSLS